MGAMLQKLGAAPTITPNIALGMNKGRLNINNRYIC